ncbi:MAG: TetR/AcrR family transcriptional regulator [Anaerolineae bacterium]|nr:TetR/AcrR family transcriptional regulator [Anaerolineae bacterium]
MDNRSKILYIATKLFASYGYDAVGVQQIVSEAGVTKPTLYHYFQSKQGLFETIVEEKSEPLLSGLREVSHYNGDITRSITAVTQFYFNYLDHDPTFYRLLLMTWFMPPASEVYAVVDRLHYQQFEMLEQLFIDAAKDHGNMRGRHKQYAVSLRGTIDTYIGLSLQGYIQLNDSQRVYRIVHQFMHGIFS